jgi:hypothetical protein
MSGKGSSKSQQPSIFDQLFFRKTATLTASSTPKTSKPGTPSSSKEHTRKKKSGGSLSSKGSSGNRKSKSQTAASKARRELLRQPTQRQGDSPSQSAGSESFLLTQSNNQISDISRSSTESGLAPQQQQQQQQQRPNGVVPDSISQRLGSAAPPAQAPPSILALPAPQQHQQQQYPPGYGFPGVPPNSQPPLSVYDPSMYHPYYHPYHPHPHPHQYYPYPTAGGAVPPSVPYPMMPYPMAVPPPYWGVVAPGGAEGRPTSRRNNRTSLEISVALQESLEAAAMVRICCFLRFLFF